MLNTIDKKAINKTIEIIQAEMDKVFKQYNAKRRRRFYSLETVCYKIHLLIECRNRLQTYFINGLSK